MDARHHFSDSKKHIDTLTSLRFFAAFYVLIFHSGGPALSRAGLLPGPLVNFVANGYLGVTFFFILSGFILTYVYHAGLNSSDELKSYATARIARVYPVYLLSLLLMVPFVGETSIQKALPQFFMLQSWIPLVWSDGSYLDNWNMQSWTLSVELFFYATFPFLLRMMRLRSNIIIILAAFVVATVMTVFRLPEIRGDQNLITQALFYIPVPLLRFPEFIFGVLLGLLFCRGAIPFSKLGFWSSLVVLVALLCLSRSPWVAPAAAILIGAIIVLVPGSIGQGAASKLLAHPAMVALGGASYGIYILQLPIHRITHAMLGSHIGSFAYFPILICVSLLAFFWYEEPLRHIIKNVR